MKSEIAPMLRGRSSHALSGLRQYDVSPVTATDSLKSSLSASSSHLSHPHSTDKHHQFLGTYLYSLPKNRSHTPSRPSEVEMNSLRTIPTRALPLARTRFFSTSPLARKSAVDTAKDTAKAADRTIADAAVKGIEKSGESLLPPLLHRPSPPLAAAIRLPPPPPPNALKGANGKQPQNKPPPKPPPPSV